MRNSLKYSSLSATRSRKKALGKLRLLHLMLRYHQLIKTACHGQRSRLVTHLPIRSAWPFSYRSERQESPVLCLSLHGRRTKWAILCSERQISRQICLSLKPAVRHHSLPQQHHRSLVRSETLMNDNFRQGTHVPPLNGGGMLNIVFFIWF